MTSDRTIIERMRTARLRAWTLIRRAMRLERWAPPYLDRTIRARELAGRLRERGRDLLREMGEELA